MKRIFILIILSVFVVGNALGAMTCDYTNFDDNPKSMTAIYTITCTADTTPGTMNYTLTEDEMKWMDGARVTLLTARPGGTVPTTDCDVGIVDSKGAVLMTNTVNGLNLADNGDTRSEYFEGPNGDMFPLFSKENPITIDIANNAVNDSVVIFDFELAF